MGHNDLMGQAEDVADQVSTAPLETTTVPRVERPLRSGSWSER